MFELSGYHEVKQCVLELQKDLVSFGCISINVCMMSLDWSAEIFMGTCMSSLYDTQIFQEGRQTQLRTALAHSPLFLPELHQRTSSPLDACVNDGFQYKTVIKDSHHLYCRVL